MNNKEITPFALKKIDRLYGMHDSGENDNVIPFQAAVSSSAKSLIDDVVALMEHPEYRHIAEPILRDALYQVSRKLIF